MSHDPVSDNRTDEGVAVPSGTPPSEPPSGDDSVPVGRQRQRLPLLIGIAATVLVLDLVTKIAAVAHITPGEPVWLIGDVVSLRLVRNPGAAFSMATGMTWVLTLVAVIVVVCVARMGRTLHSSWWALGLGLVLGGALGNLVDRFFRAPGFMQGHVVDFVSVGWWPVFNVADSAIVCAAVLLVALTLFGIEPRGGEK
ncbi:signal peptidase II [Rhodococcus sp. NPDC058521]|uniref:signal peptidase II n=1 Tax=Rhodococcus sp. NPDC058521 TaxID=3346536 RepID=UPI003650B45D